MQSPPSSPLDAAVAPKARVFLVARSGALWGEMQILGLPLGPDVPDRDCKMVVLTFGVVYWYSEPCEEPAFPLTDARLVVQQHHIALPTGV